MDMKEWEDLLEREFDENGTLPLLRALGNVAAERARMFGVSSVAGSDVLAARWHEIAAWAHAQVNTGQW